MTSTVLLADGHVGAHCVEWLLANHREDIDLIGVTGPNEIYRRAIDAGVAVEFFVDSRQMSEAIAKHGLSPDIGLLLWWPKIIREPLISVPRAGFINTHPSFLPYNRGKHYSFWAIVEQAPFGVTLHLVDTGVDTGDIIAQMPISIHWTDTGQSLFEKAREAMISLVKDTYPILRSDNFVRRPQPMDVGSCHRSQDIIDATELKLDQSYIARELLNLLRAKTFEGLPGCWFEDDGRIFEISISIKERK